MPAEQIMREFYAGTLKSSNGAPVTELAQAKAIAASYEHEGAGRGREARRRRTLKRGAVKIRARSGR